MMPIALRKNIDKTFSKIMSNKKDLKQIKLEIGKIAYRHYAQRNNIEKAKMNHIEPF